MHNTHTCVDLRLLAPCPGGAGLWLFGSAPLPTIVHHGQDSHFDLLPTLNENWGGGGCGGAGRMLLPISYRQKKGDDWWKPADRTGQRQQDDERGQWWDVASDARIVVLRPAV